MKPTVLVCGGGNGAHIMTGLASSRDVNVRVMSIHKDEAARWQELCSKSDMEIIVHNLDGSTVTIRSRPSLITNDPQIAVPGVDIIIITVPAFCHESYLEAISPHLRKNTIIVGLPGQMGFEFQCGDIFQGKIRNCAILSTESLPWACRINEFGQSATIIGFKESLACSIINSTDRTTEEIISCIQNLFGDYPNLYSLKSYMTINLMSKSYVHPPMMFTQWKDFDGMPLKEKPLFYHAIDSYAARLLTEISDEILQTARVIDKVKPNADLNLVTSLMDKYLVFYGDQIQDKTNLLTAFRTNKAYDGLMHPMKSAEGGGLLPDFSHRFMTEDIPFGMCVFRGMAEIVGIPTPATDEVILWCQKAIGKEYLINGRLQGKDVIETRAPQRYGFTTVEQLFSLEK